MKIMWFSILLIYGAVHFTASIIFQWAIEMFNLPFEIWEEMK